MHGREHAKGIIIWVGIYAVLLFGSSGLLDRNLVTWLPLRVIVALVPMIPACGILMHTMRTYRKLDELEQKIVGESIMFAFGATAILTFSYGFLQRFVGAPDLSYFFVWVVLAATWFVGGRIARFRYR